MSGSHTPSSAAATGQEIKESAVPAAASPGLGLCECLRCFPPTPPAKAATYCRSRTDEGTAVLAAFLSDGINGSHSSPVAQSGAVKSDSAAQTHTLKLSSHFALPLCNLIAQYVIDKESSASTLQETPEFAALRVRVEEQTKAMLQTDAFKLPPYAPVDTSALPRSFVRRLTKVSLSRFLASSFSRFCFCFIFFLTFCEVEVGNCLLVCRSCKQPLSKIKSLAFCCVRRQSRQRRSRFCKDLYVLVSLFLCFCVVWLMCCVVRRSVASNYRTGGHTVCKRHFSFATRVSGFTRLLCNVSNEAACGMHVCVCACLCLCVSLLNSLCVCVFIEIGVCVRAGDNDNPYFPL